MKPTRTRVKRWMQRELAFDRQEYEDSAGKLQMTPLAEAAAAYFDPTDSWLDDPDHWVWDAAFEVVEWAEETE